MKQRLHPFLHKLPPGPGKFPYLQIGPALKALENPLGTFLGFYHEYGPAYTLRFLGTEIVMLVGHEANQHILVDNAKNFSWGEGWLGELTPFIGPGILTTDGEIHDRARRLLLPIFRPDRIAAYAERMVARATAAAETLTPDRPFDMQAWTRGVALQVASDILFGMKTDDRLARRFAHEFDRGLAYFGYPIQLQVLRGPGTPWNRMMSARRRLDRMLYAEIRRRRREGHDGENILDLLIRADEAGDRFTDDEIRHQVTTLLFAGHDTTTATVAWMTMLLGQHMGPRDCLQAELDARLGDRPAEAGDLIGGLPYLDQVLAETLRMFPAAWVGPRKAIEDFEIYGHRIPGGTHVAYSSWLTQRLPQYFPDPDMFDPERFADNKVKALPPGAYVPFGRGQRLCIGMRFGELEAKALMATMMQRFRLELIPGQDFRAHTVPTISPRHGVMVIPRTRARAAAVARRRPAPATGNGACPIAHA